MMISRRAVYFILIQLGCAFQLSGQADFQAVETEGCTPFSTTFSIDETTVDMDTVSRIDWHFGRGDTLTAVNPDTVIFAYEGSYTIAMVINGDRENAVVKTDYIVVHRTLSAAFQYEEFAPNNNYRFVPADVITDSLATYFFLWEYEKSDGSDMRNKDYTVTFANQKNAVDSITLDTGVYVIQLTVMDTYGCESSFSQRLYVTPEILVPNIFFPDIDEFLIIDSRNPNTALKFQVFNRYGLLVFSQTAPTITWNGRTNNGTYLTAGVYFYVLEAVGDDVSDRHNQRGFIHLYRSRNR